MIYTISRDTPEGGDLKKVPAADLKHIASLVSKLGIKTQVFRLTVMKNQNILICPLEWGLGHAARMIPLARKLGEMGEQYLHRLRRGAPCTIPQTSCRGSHI